MPGVTVSGRVAAPLVLRFADLLAFQAQVEDVSLIMPGRRGSAVPLGAVLTRAQVAPGATHAVLMSRDGAFTATVTLAEVAGALLIYRLGTEPLPETDGGPVRYLNPDAGQCAPDNKAACANVKHLGAIEIISR